MICISKGSLGLDEQLKGEKTQVFRHFPGDIEAKRIEVARLLRALYAKSVFSRQKVVIFKEEKLQEMAFKGTRVLLYLFTYIIARYTRKNS